jgi:hypothetical protein
MAHFEELTFDWASGPVQQNPATLEGAGLICETARFDSFYNAAGDPIVLPAGQKYKSKKDQSFRSALTVTTHWGKGQDPLYTILEIKSPHMKAALKDIIPEYTSFNIAMNHITIKNEPRCLFLYREELRSYGEDLQNTNPEAAKHVCHLMSYMWDVLSTDIISFGVWADSSDDDAVLNHKLLWMIFKPGEIIFVRKPRLRAFVFEEMNLEYKTWKLKGHCMDYNGSMYGFRSFQTSIEHFDDLKPLKELNIVPSNRLSDSEKHALRTQLVARGRKFIGIHGHRYLWHDGKCELYRKGSGMSHNLVRNMHSFLGSLYLTN